MKGEKTIRRISIVLMATLVVISVIRLFFLPLWLKQHINDNLTQLEGYTASYNDISISLLTGSFSLNDVEVKRNNSRVPLPFFTAEKLEIGLDWTSARKGALVSEIHLLQPSLNFIKGPDSLSSQTRISNEWIDVFRNLSTLPVNTIDILAGVISYHDFHSTPRVELFMREIGMSAKNLYNIDGEEKILSGVVEASGKIEDAEVNMALELNSFYKAPMFKLNAELLTLDLTVLKEFLKAYGGIEVDQGIFSVYTQASTKSNKVVGYVKPLIEDITIASNQHFQTLSMQRDERNPKLTLVTLRNGNNLNEIQFEGDLDDPELNIWDAVGITLHNAFIEGLMMTLEKSIQPSQAPARIKQKTDTSKASQVKEEKQGFLKRIFKKNKNKKNRDN